MSENNHTQQQLPDPLTVIQETAQQLLQWANEAVRNGWSTFQNPQMRGKAKELYAVYSMHIARRHNNSNLMLQAAEIIEDDAETLKGCHAVNGVWVINDEMDAEALKTYMRNTLVATALRAAATGSDKLPFHVKPG